MPSTIPNKPEIAGAICAPPPQQSHTSGDGVEAPVQQPRQPTTLNGLLKFAMDATKAEDAPQQSHFLPLDEERKKFLEQALQSLTIDVIEEILKQIRILEKINELKPDQDPSEYVEAFEQIADFVCDIDAANDFHKIGGFMVLQPCLKCCNPKVRAQAGNLLAELCQNNPYCQRVVLENGFMPILIDLVENDEDVTVVVKAIYAISSIIRQNPNGCAQFIQYKGVQIFLEVLKRNEEKSSTKVCFLLNALCASQPDFKSRLVFMDYIPALFSLLNEEPNQSHEHALELLIKLIEDNTSIINECRLPKYDYNILLNTYRKKIEGKEEFNSVEENCTELMGILHFDNTNN